jgi:Lysophospholipase L1 and related esterases
MLDGYYLRNHPSAQFGTIATSGVVYPWKKTRAILREYLEGTTGADNPHSLPAMANPPSISTSTADLSPTYPKTITLANQGDIDTYCRIEGGRQELVSTNFMRPYQARMNAGTVVNVVSRISFTANADLLAFYVIGSALPYRFLVDGAYVDFAGTLPAAASGTGSNYIILQFASKAVRVITIELQQNQALRRIHIKNADSFGAKPQARPHRGIVLGDSITGAAIATHFGDGLCAIAGDYLGIPDFWASGVGATGYVNTSGGTRYKLAERIAADLDSALLYGALDIVVVAMGINDIGLAGVTAEANVCFDIIRQKCPAAIVPVLGPWDAAAPSPPAASYLACKAAIQAAVAGRGGFSFIDTQGVAYAKADAVHPNTAGHNTLGQWLEGQIRAIAALEYS